MPSEKRSPTRADVESDIERVARELGAVPTKRDMVERGRYTEWAYTRQFAPYSELVEETGLTERKKDKPYLHEPENVAEIEEDVRRIAVYLEKRPTIREMVRYGRFTAYAYQHARGSYSALLDHVLDEG